jgi:hypothetical protein
MLTSRQEKMAAVRSGLRWDVILKILSLERVKNLGVGMREKTLKMILKLGN